MQFHDALLEPIPNNCVFLEPLRPYPYSKTPAKAAIFLCLTWSSTRPVAKRRWIHPTPPSKTPAK